MGPAAGTDVLEKKHISYACQKSNPSLFSQKRNDYTELAILAPVEIMLLIKYVPETVYRKQTWLSSLPLIFDSCCVHYKLRARNMLCVGSKSMMITYQQNVKTAVYYHCVKFSSCQTEQNFQL